jgi:hypothetical protein
MSVQNYFEKVSFGQANDSLYPYWRELLKVQAELPELRQKQLLQCCVVTVGKAGKAELLITNQALFDTLTSQLEQSEARVKTIAGVFSEIDNVVEEVKAKGLQIKEPTASGVRRLKIDAQNRLVNASIYQRGQAAKALEAGTSIAEINTKVDPILEEQIAILQEAEAKCLAAVAKL